MASSNSQSQHHHHHNDSTSLYRQRMFGRSKRKKIMTRCLWFAGMAIALVLAMCVVFAYVIDK